MTKLTKYYLGMSVYFVVMGVLFKVFTTGAGQMYAPPLCALLCVVCVYLALEEHYYEGK